MSLRQKVFQVVRNDPDISLKSLKKQFKDESYNSVRTYRNQILKLISKNISRKKKNTTSNKKYSSHSTQPTGGGHSNPSLNNKLLDPEYYSNVNIKTLLMNSSINDILHDKNVKSSRDLLSQPQFIDRSRIEHDIFWNASTKPYHRPDFFYSNQNVAIEMMHNAHMMYQGGRQKIGKTTAAFNADFEDMLYTKGTVVTLVAPGLKQAAALLRQGFKEQLTLPDGSKFDLWSQLYEPYFLVDNVQTYIMKNGSRLQVIACSEHTTPGYATDILHIEELDKIVKDPQALRGLGAVLPTIRARRGFARLRITCNNTSGIYRILREDLKDLYPWVIIYMEKPYDINTQEFTGEHIIYNDSYYYKCPECKENKVKVCTHPPDIDIILRRIMDCIMGESYTQQQFGNIDDYEDDVFNPDKVDLAYKKGKTFVPHEVYDHTVMSIDPGAVHDFAVGIIGMEGLDFYHLWNENFSISGKTPKEAEIMLKRIAKACAIEYVRYNCEIIISESNSGAKLIVPLINHYIRKEIERIEGATFAEVNDPVWSNWGGDKEQGPEAPKIYSRVEFITLLQYIFDYQKLTLQDRNKHEHKMRIQFSRYKPEDSKEKYKGDSVDMIMHALWYLSGGRSYIERLLGLDEEVEVAFTY